MATQVLTDAMVILNGVTLSNRVKSVTINYQAELLDDTAMGAAARSRKGGLKDWDLTIECFADEAASNVIQTLFALVGSTFAIEIRPTSGARSATNPGYTGTGILESAPVVAGSVGEMQMMPVSIKAAGTVLSRQIV